jgi:pilus assembly protein Flp/PilA
VLLLFGWILDRTHRREDGQGLAEYALILALIAVAAIVVMGLLGGAIGDIFQQIINDL